MSEEVKMFQTANIRVANIVARSSDERLPQKPIAMLEAEKLYAAMKRARRQDAGKRTKG